MVYPGTVFYPPRLQYTGRKECRGTLFPAHYKGNDVINNVKLYTSLKIKQMKCPWSNSLLLATTYLLHISGMRHNLPHPVSSLPSVQSRVPSQRSEEGMHWALVHRNALVPQETAIGDSNFKGQVREQNKWSLNTF